MSNEKFIQLTATSIKVEFGRTTKTADYEGSRIGLIAEFPAGTCPDVAFKTVQEKVEQWVQADLDERGVIIE